MDVTQQLFDTILPDFLEHLEGCDFVAMDEEMTGISIANGKVINELTTVEERYPIMKEVAERFNIIQMGLALFKRLPDGSYESRPFNFFVFPQKSDIGMSGDAIQFLKKNGLNIDKWCYKGVPYLDAAGEKAERLRLFPEEAEGGAEKAKEVELTADADKEWYEQWHAKIQLWKGKVAEQRARGVDADSAEAEAGSISIKGSRFQRAYLEQEAKKEGDFICSNKREGPNFMLVLTYSSAEEIAKKEEERRQNLEATFKNAVGFRRLWSALQASKKPVVVHNGLYDVLFARAAFEGDLPDTYQEFRELAAKENFNIFDTKYLAALINEAYLAEQQEQGVEKIPPRFSGNWMALGDLYSTSIQEEDYPQIRLPLGFHTYRQDVLAAGGKAHEAAYDAHMTGCVFAHFLQQAHLVGPLHAISNDRAKEVLSQAKDGGLSLVQPARNICNLFKGLQHADFNLGHTDPEAYPRKLKVLVKNLTKKTSTALLQSACGPLRVQKGREAYVLWVDDTTAVIEFPPGPTFQDVQAQLADEAQKNHWELQTFADYLASKAQGSSMETD